ncbi:PREDICTED: zinc finger CCHC domain-containing protein 10-like [Tarenaya hassleriana]|uniref:zinc finger CCHC domain-containing protein 10-like n=1 Tax=Tarenaya hassleriana TaxID=28532 RepID=UPI00053C8BCC|nr:PREDICTED: zinc finger CCHC domain-containing protein 10-like [Tarenaya hassleriana]XP_010524735.1 PREDICTED: zinc finger CCHC domain-containing protein 10-like [Tarenaya hassleriana]
MSSSKEEKAQAAAEKIKAAALTAAKGLSRAQAERAATAAARNVNAYGQKEEGPSRWQEKREAKRQMYLMSTEKAVRLGERKDKSGPSAIGRSASQCQKCFQTGHWTYECKNERVYISRPSRTQQLKNPKLRMRLSISYELEGGNPDAKTDGEEAEKRSKKNKRKRRSDSDSGSDSENDSGSSSVTGSDTSGGRSSDYSSYSSDSEEERRRKKKKKKQRKGRRGRYSSSSSEASDSDSDDDDRSSKRKSKRHSRYR